MATNLPKNIICYVATFLDQKSWFRFNQVCKNFKVPNKTLYELYKPPIEILDRFTGVRILRLSGAKVTDISPLSNCKQLQELYLSDTKVPKQQVDDLKQKLPQLTICFI